MSYLQLIGVAKTYKGASAPVLKDFDLSVEKGEILVILGASGCGKTTALKIVSGLERQEAGHVILDGRTIDSLNPEKRSTAMVFQKSLLFRNMTVAENISFAPRLNRAMSKTELRRKTEEMLALLRLEGMGGKRVTELSGGQEQRVSLGRALMTEPKLLLLDEPLSALDTHLKWALLAHIKELNRKLGATMLYVTHDQKEAAAAADRVAFLHGGAVTRCAKPYEFYSRPASQAEADFFGWENRVPAEKEGTRVRCVLGSFEIDGAKGKDGGGWLYIRPEATENIGGGRLRGVVSSVMPQGMETVYELLCEGMRLKLAVSARHAFAAGETMTFDLNPQMMWPVASDPNE
ncbi:MAG: ABC transporter ATP-binding protein [Peptococcaceae bacterium]|jgi:ABC-type Fe3+/spermidine/putrescine transport system ATPase subunit|nr:ABC transporter ATP-binding protein [Peptococcaceae bacterium]